MREWRWVVASVMSLAACGEHPTAAWADKTSNLVPPPAYARWWQELEACTGMSGDFTSVQWEIVASDLIPRKEREVGGVYFRDRRLIQLAAPYVTHSGLVKHEMLHALSPVGGHGHWAYAVHNPCGVTPHEYLAWEPVLDSEIERGP
jgi:hypothetical protein